jgi:hypothetical protein
MTSSEVTITESRKDTHFFFWRRGFTGDTKHAFVKYRSQFANQ